jgi:dipeptidyl aminopeptidase/acylaminoacyl peptidase
VFSVYLHNSQEIVEKEGHGFSEEENRIEKLKRISAFFKKYLAT